MQGKGDFPNKNLARGVVIAMYKHNERQTILPGEFFLPFGGELNDENRWCKLAQLIPWAEIEDRYRKNFRRGNGQKAFPVRVALGALVIQNYKNLSDESVVEEISENPYMQYFLGFKQFVQKKPFHASMMVHFRKRLGKDVINEINELIAIAEKPPQAPDDDQHPGGGQTVLEHEGKLILDATCAPADIHYPTDLGLLNEVREQLEEIVDALHQPHIGKRRKPRTYRNQARRQYLNIDKKKAKTLKLVRKGIGQQLRYIKRNLKTIGRLAQESPLSLLSQRQYRRLVVCNEIYRQQQEMYHTRTHRIEDRIVSIHMPFVRPIVRGKAKAPVEFGAKLAISVVNGYSFMEHLSFDAFNEGTTLIESINRYRERFGVYPESVIADKIYRNRENLAFCKSLGIRLSGPPLGRPSKDAKTLRQHLRDERADARVRNSVEGVSAPANAVTDSTASCLVYSRPARQ